MESTAKKKARIIQEYKGEDRISNLPDELIHKILSFRDAKEAVQTSVLSKRWKLIWTTLPFLGFGRYYNRPFKDLSRYSMFIHHVLSNRNHQSPLFELQMFVPGKLSVKRSVSRKRYRGCVIENFIKYAISHNVQDLDICFGVRYKHETYKLSTFSSNSLKKLTLHLKLALESESWDLPALTTLHLKGLCFDARKFSDYSCFTCLRALRTLCLDNWDLSKLSFSFSLPDLTTLRLCRGKLPRAVWDLPALLSLDLDIVSLPENMSDMLSSLVNLKNLTISFYVTSIHKDHFISCPQLLNLNIRNPRYDPRCGNFMVSAPKLCNFTSVGIFSITFGVRELENVNIRLSDWEIYEDCVLEEIDYQRITFMLSGLGNAKNLSFDTWSIKALSAISDFLASVPSPFYNLKYVKLPQGYKESSISGPLRSYLLGGSPGATIVRSWPQNMTADDKSKLQDLQARVDDAKSELQDLQARVDDAKSELQDLQARIDDAKAKLQDLQALRAER